MAFISGIVGFVTAAFVATFVEYWGHRLMHFGKLLGKHHAGHHAKGTGQGWLREFRDYAVPSIPGLGLGFLVSPAVGVGWFAGGLSYAACAAFAHQLQHERPTQVFWLTQPVHAVHHHHQEWHHNFGLTVDFWDRVFGTYRAHPPVVAFEALEDGKPWYAISILRPSAPLPVRPPRHGAT